MTRTLCRFWKDLTSAEFEALDKDRTIAVLPLAAIEQHGPHLPVSVDASINDGIRDRAIGLLPSELPVIFLPCLEVGASIEHIAFPGTLSLPAETAMRCWRVVAESVARAGIRKLVMFNSHGGNRAAMDIVARDLRAEKNMLVAAVSWFDFGVPDGLFDEVELRHGIHGGAIETAMMLHLRPDLVRLERVKAFPTHGAILQDEGGPGARTPRIRFAWMAQDLHPEGVGGDPRTATAESGAMLVDHAARGLVRLLESFDRLPLSRLGRRD